MARIVAVRTKLYKWTGKTVPTQAIFRTGAFDLQAKTVLTQCDSAGRANALEHYLHAGFINVKSTLFSGEHEGKEYVN